MDRKRGIVKGLYSFRKGWNLYLYTESFGTGKLHFKVVRGLVIEHFPYMNYHVPFSSALEGENLELLKSLPVV